MKKDPTNSIASPKSIMLSIILPDWRNSVDIFGGLGVLWGLKQGRPIAKNWKKGRQLCVNIVAQDLDAQNKASFNWPIVVGGQALHCVIQIAFPMGLKVKWPVLPVMMGPALWNLMLQCDSPAMTSKTQVALAPVTLFQLKGPLRLWPEIFRQLISMKRQRRPTVTANLCPLMPFYGSTINGKFMLTVDLFQIFLTLWVFGLRPHVTEHGPRWSWPLQNALTLSFYCSVYIYTQQLWLKICLQTMLNPSHFFICTECCPL